MKSLLFLLTLLYFKEGLLSESNGQWTVWVFSDNKAKSYEIWYKTAIWAWGSGYIDNLEEGGKDFYITQRGINKIGFLKEQIARKK